MRGQRGRAAGPKELARRRVTRARPAWRRDGPQAKVIAFFQCLVPRLGERSGRPTCGVGRRCSAALPAELSNPASRPNRAGD